MNRFAHAFGETFRAIIGDRVAMLTLVGAVVLYSFFYPAAYRHQVAVQLPLVVVDQDHSAMSRSLLRKLAAVRAVHVAGVVGSMDHARRAVERGDAEAVLVVPADFQRDILRVLTAVLFGALGATLTGSALLKVNAGNEAAKVTISATAGLALLLIAYLIPPYWNPPTPSKSNCVANPMQRGC